jgi:hypothetical protein
MIGVVVRRPDAGDYFSSFLAQRAACGFTGSRIKFPEHLFHGKWR